MLFGFLTLEKFGFVVRFLKVFLCLFLFADQSEGRREPVNS